jgi:hypothetical protein
MSRASACTGEPWSGAGRHQQDHPRSSRRGVEAVLPYLPLDQAAAWRTRGGPRPPRRRRRVRRSARPPQPQAQGAANENMSAVLIGALALILSLYSPVSSSMNGSRPSSSGSARSRASSRSPGSTSDTDRFVDTVQKIEDRLLSFEIEDIRSRCATAALYRRRLVAFRIVDRAASARTYPAAWISPRRTCALGSTRRCARSTAAQLRSALSNSAAR